MGSGASFPADQHIVVIGAGYAGSNIGRSLLKGHANFTIIDSRDVFHHSVGAVRAVVEEGFANKTLIPLKETFGDHFKQGKVTSIDPASKQVKLESGETVSYGILVIATGSSGPFPCKFEVDKSRDAALLGYKQFYEKVKGSKKIAIIGGGACGIEIAGEIATDYKDKEVTVIHPHDFLVSDKMSQSFQKRLKEVLKNLKVNVVYGERVTNVDAIPEDGGPVTLTTDKGNSYAVDMAIKCTGLYVNKESYEQTMGDKMNEGGFLKCNEFLQVEGHDDIFACGDCCDRDVKKAYMASLQAPIVADNISKKLKKQAMKAYKPGSAPIDILLSVGRRNGLGQRKGGGGFPEFLVKTLKCGDMFAGKYWKEMGQKLPK